MSTNKTYDVIIIGGSYAGLSAALALGRSLRQVLIIDGGKPCNRFTPHSHNFLTQDGEKPEDIAQKAREQVLRYDTVKLINDGVVQASRWDNGFRVATLNGQEYKTKKLILATGIKDLIPEIKGFQACWGISVIHCPYCHGYEFRNQPTGILANGERAFHIAGLVRNLTGDITILTNGKADFTDEQVQTFNNQKIHIIENNIAEIKHKNGQIESIVFEDGLCETFKAIYAAIPFAHHSDLHIQLGCELTELGYIQTDEFQRTSIAGIFACGDNNNPMRSVANAVYRGNMAGVMANKELTNEQFV